MKNRILQTSLIILLYSIIVVLLSSENLFGCHPRWPDMSNIYVGGKYIGYIDGTSYRECDGGNTVNTPPPLYSFNNIFNSRDITVQANFYESCDGRSDYFSIWVCNLDYYSCNWQEYCDQVINNRCYKNGQFTGWFRVLSKGCRSCNNINLVNEPIQIACNKAGYCRYRFRLINYDYSDRCGENDFYKRHPFDVDVFGTNSGQIVEARIEALVKGEPTYTLIVPDTTDTLMNTHNFTVRILDNNLDNSHQNDGYYSCYYRIIQNKNDSALGNYDSGWLKRPCGFYNKYVSLNIYCPYEGKCTIRSFVNSPTEQWYDTRSFYVQNNDRFVSYLKFDGKDYDVIGFPFSSYKSYNCKNDIAIFAENESSYCGEFLDDISLVSKKFDNPTKNGYYLYANGPTADQFCKEHGYDYVKSAEISRQKTNNYLSKYKNKWVLDNNFFYFTSITCMKLVGKKIQAKCVKGTRIGYGTYTIQKFPRNYGSVEIEISGDNISLLKDYIEPVIIKRFDYRSVGFSNFFKLTLENNLGYDLNNYLIEINIKDVLKKYGDSFIIKDGNGNKVNYCFESKNGVCSKDPSNFILIPIKDFKNGEKKIYYIYDSITRNDNPNNVYMSGIVNITLTNPNNYDLRDFQVKVDLSSVKDKVGNNFVILDENGNKVNYCFEQSNGECNKNPSNVIWVKVPFIPANGNTELKIKKSNTNGAVNGDKVFDFYDNLNNFNLPIAYLSGAHNPVIDDGTYYYWLDAGKDAFDRYGYSFIYFNPGSSGSSTQIYLKDGNSGNKLRYITGLNNYRFFIYQDWSNSYRALREIIIVCENNNENYNHYFSFYRYGNLGSDSDTYIYYYNFYWNGNNLRFVYSYDWSYNKYQGDPNIFYFMLGDNINEQNSGYGYYYSRSNDNLYEYYYRFKRFLITYLAPSDSYVGEFRNFLQSDLNNIYNYLKKHRFYCTNNKLRVRKYADLKITYVLQKNVAQYNKKVYVNQNLEFIEYNNDYNKNIDYEKTTYKRSFKNNRLHFTVPIDNLSNDEVISLKVENGFKKPGIYKLHVEIYPQKFSFFKQSFDWVISLGNKVSINNKIKSVSIISTPGGVLKVENFTINGKYPKNTIFYLLENLTLKRWNYCMPEKTNTYYIIEPFKYKILLEPINITIAEHIFNPENSLERYSFTYSIKGKYISNKNVSSYEMLYVIPNTSMVKLNFQKFTFSLKDFNDVNLINSSGNNSLIIYKNSKKDNLYYIYDNQTYYKGILIDNIFIVYDKNLDKLYDHYINLKDKKEYVISNVENISNNLQLIKIENNTYLINIESKTYIKGKIFKYKNKEFLVFGKLYTIDINTNKKFPIRINKIQFYKFIYIDIDDNKIMNIGDLLLYKNKICKVIKIEKDEKNKILIIKDDCGNTYSINLIEYIKGIININNIIELPKKPNVIEFYADNKLITSISVKSIDK